MTFSDPVANMLTIIRNANMRGHRLVKFPYSNFKWRICQKLAETKYLAKCQKEEKEKKIAVEIKYTPQGSRIHQIKKISKPTQHIHLRAKDISKNCQRWGTYFISTSYGLLTHREALVQKQGGKLLFFIN